MNILFVSEEFPYPLNTGGNVRTYHLLKALSQEHQVTLVAGARTDLSAADREAVARLCAAIHVVDVGVASILSEIKTLAFSFVRGRSFLINRRYRKTLAQVIKQYAGRTSSTDQNETTIDLVYLNHLDAALYLPLLTGSASLWLDAHNVVTHQIATMRDSESSGVRRLVLALDLPRLRSFERQVLRRVDGVSACSPDDAASLRDLGANNIRVVPNGVDVEYFKPGTDHGGKPHAVFVGTMDYLPCERAAWNFCKEILPLIRRREPDFQFSVIGRNPSDRLQEFAANDEKVECTGVVPDIRPYLRRASVTVVPLESGSGTRLKILESMAAGVPVVSTTIGAEGLAVEDGVHLHIADAFAEFAEKVLAVHESPENALQMAKSARQLAVGKYSWQSAGQTLLSSLKGCDAVGTASNG